MPTSDDTDPNEWKLLVALLGIFIYIAASWWFVGFSWNGFVIFFTALALILNHDFSKKDVLGDPKVLALFVVWIVVLFGGSWFFPEYVMTRYFLMFAVAITAGMELENMIIFLGTTLLCVLIFGSNVISFIVIITMSLFIYSAKEDVGAGIAMLIPLLAVGWFIGSGWGNIVEQKVSAITTQVGATTGVTPESVDNQVTAALNNTWLLFTDPNAWYEKQFVERGARDDGATSAALEITRIEAIPKNVMLGDDFDIVFELYNKGKEPAANVKIMAKGDEIADACGKVNGKTCNYLCSAEKTPISVSSCSYGKFLKTIPQKDKRYETISFSAPQCPGTYAVGAQVIYDYVAYGTLSFEMISRSYYSELLRNDKLEFKDPLSVSSAGPFKVTLRTSRQQPIPDIVDDGDAKENFTLYTGILNEREGTATLNELDIFIPDVLEAADIMDPNCKLIYDGTLTAEKCKSAKALPSGTLCSAYLTNAAPTKLSELLRASKENPKETKPFDTIRKDASALAKIASDEQGYIQYVPQDMSGEIDPNNMRYFKCDFHTTASVEQIKTFNVKTKVNYTYKYVKKTPVTVRGNAASAGVAAPDCKRKIQIQQDATAPDQTVPQTRDAALTSLAIKMAGCYKTNTEGWDSSSDECAKIRVNMAKCGDKITKESLLEAVNRYRPDLKEGNVAIYLDKGADPVQQLSGNEIYVGTVDFTGGYHVRITDYLNPAEVSLNLGSTRRPETECPPPKQ